MALKRDFYEEIFKKEIYWTELAPKNLINIYYINGRDGIKDFYKQKREELQKEYQINQSEVLKLFLNMINEIILEIDSLTKNYENGITIDITALINLFLINQMNNNFVSNNSYKKL